MENGGFELGVKSPVMIKEIDGLQYLYTKDPKAVVTEEKKTMLCLYVTYSQEATQAETKLLKRLEINTTGKGCLKRFLTMQYAESVSLPT